MKNEVMQAEVKNLINYFSKYVTPERFGKIKQLVKQRTRYITVVLEDIYQSHNAGAILRSCEAFGIQDIHCIIDTNEFTVNNGIARGAAQWLNYYEYRQHAAETTTATYECLKTLKKDGYKIVATSPHATMPLSSLPLDNKLAFIFGTEFEGITEEATDQADYLVSIPMHGFTESFNVSVSVALCLYDITHRLRASSNNWHLSNIEQEDLILDWLRTSVEHPDLLEKEYRKLLQK